MAEWLRFDSVNFCQESERDSVVVLTVEVFVGSIQTNASSSGHLSYSHSNPFRVARRDK